MDTAKTQDAQSLIDELNQLLNYLHAIGEEDDDMTISDAISLNEKLKQVVAEHYNVQVN